VAAAAFCGVYTTCQKRATFIVLNNSAKHWPILMIFGIQRRDETGRGQNDHSFAHPTMIPLLHYLVKCQSHSFAGYNTEFILGSTRFF